MKEKEEKRIIYISSMGGHLKELLALKKSMKQFKSYIITEKTDATSFLKDLEKGKNKVKISLKKYIIYHMVLKKIYLNIYLYL